MQPQELTPEDLFQRALKILEDGHLEKAIKLLQVASLKAPWEARYQEALQEAKRLRSQKADQKVDTIDPEILYNDALKCIEDGELEQAARMLKIAQARAPRVAKYREALEKVREARAPKRSELEEQGEELSKAASEDLEKSPEEIPVSQEVRQDTRRYFRRRIMILLPVGLLLAVIVFFFTRDSRPVDAGPYSQFAPIQQAKAVGYSMEEELVLIVDKAAWQRMSPKERQTAAERILVQAAQDGFDSSFVYTADNKLLASINGDLIYFPED